MAFLRGKRAKDLKLGELLGDDVWLNPRTDTIYLSESTFRYIPIGELTAIVDAGFNISLSGHIRYWFYRNLMFPYCSESIWWDKYEKWQLVKRAAGKQKSWEITVGIVACNFMLPAEEVRSHGLLSDLCSEPGRLAHVDAHHRDKTTRVRQAVDHFARNYGLDKQWIQTRLRHYAKDWCREQDRYDDGHGPIEDLVRDTTSENMVLWHRWDEAKASFLSMLDGFQEFVPVLQIVMGLRRD